MKNVVLVPSKLHANNSCFVFDSYEKAARFLKKNGYRENRKGFWRCPDIIKCYRIYRVGEHRILQGK